MEGVLNLNEAFKAFDIIEEDAFSVDKKGIEELNDYLKDGNIEQDVDLSVFDVDAENEGELKDSYVGDVILNCSICNSKLFKNPQDVIIDDEAQLANIGETCPYCQSSNGYTIIGQVKPYEEVETHIEIEDKVEESLGSDLNKYQK